MQTAGGEPCNSGRTRYPKLAPSSDSCNMSAPQVQRQSSAVGRNLLEEDLGSIPSFASLSLDSYAEAGHQDDAMQPGFEQQRSKSSRLEQDLSNFSLT